MTSVVAVPSRGPSADPVAHRSRPSGHPSAKNHQQPAGVLPHGTVRGPGLRRSAVAALGIAVCFAAVGGQLVRLAWRGQSELKTTLSQSSATSFARPDIVDRNGRLLATDVEVPSLYADPALVLDRDEVAEKLAQVLPGVDEGEMRHALADRTRRFVWIRRSLTPRQAQAVHDLGLPGLGFRRELRRANPTGSLGSHVLGAVNIDNKGLTGLERYLDDVVGVEPVHGATLTDRAPVRTSIDLGVQHSLDDELKSAMRRYAAKGAAGLVMDVATGEVVAAQSLPAIDPARPADLQDAERADRVAGGVYELGSIMKLATVAMALDGGTAGIDSVRDVREPLTAGRFTIRDPHPAGRPLTVAEIFVRSSNVGAGMLALDAGSTAQQAFLARIGLSDGARTEAGPVAGPLLPDTWGRIETITIAYGHGIAVAPLQFTAAAAALVNGGYKVRPTFLRQPPDGAGSREAVIKPETSRLIRDLMRRNVTDPAGTGRRADVPGYRVGGKTGTAELPHRGGYKETAVISSFLAAFPMDTPRYVALVMLFEPRPTVEAKGQVAAGANAAPTAGRIIARIAPLLGVLPDGAAAPMDDVALSPGPEGAVETEAADAPFDGAGDAKY